MVSSNLEPLSVLDVHLYVELALQLQLAPIALLQITELFKMGNVFVLLDSIKLLILMDL